MFILVENDEVKAMYADGYKPDIDGLIHIEGDIPNFNQEGKTHTVKYNPENNSVYAEYTDIPLTETEQLRQENEQLKNSLADLWEVVLLGGAS